MSRLKISQIKGPGSSYSNYLLSVSSDGNSLNVIENDYLPTSGGTISGNLTIDGTTSLDKGNITTDGNGNITLSGQCTAGSVRIGAGNLLTQGAHMFWNTAGSGTTDFVNGHGLGSGGFIWLDGGTDLTQHYSSVTKSNYQLMALDGSGNLTVKNNITAKGTISSPKYTVDNGSDISEIYFSNDGKNRWDIGKDNTSETGSNIGGNFVISRFADDGTYINDPIWISRATGVMTSRNGIVVPTQATTDNSQNAASTAYVQNNLSSYITHSTYVSDFYTNDLRIINLPYSHRIQAWTTTATNSSVITFPVAFSDVPISIFVQANSNSWDVGALKGTWTSTGFTLTNYGTNTANGSQQISIIAIGPK